MSATARQYCAFLPGCRNEGLGSHEEEEHDEGADQVGVEHFISHLGELNQWKGDSQHVAVCGTNPPATIHPPPPTTTTKPACELAHLVLDMRVLEHQGQWSDVLPVHTITASNLNGMFDALVDLFGGGLPDVGQ